MTPCASASFRSATVPAAASMRTGPAGPAGLAHPRAQEPHHVRAAPDPRRAGRHQRHADRTGRCRLLPGADHGRHRPAPRDVTPEATLAVADKEMPGFGEQMRQISLAFVPTAILSRQVAVIRGKSLIINLPGQPKAIAETLQGLQNPDGTQTVNGIFAAVPYCVDLIGGPIWKRMTASARRSAPRAQCAPRDLRPDRADTAIDKQPAGCFYFQPLEPALNPGPQLPFAVITQRHAACQFQCRIDLYMAMLHQCHAKHPVLVAPAWARKRSSTSRQ